MLSRIGYAEIDVLKAIPENMQPLGEFLGMDVIEYIQRKEKYDDQDFIEQLRQFKVSRSLGLIGSMGHDLLVTKGAKYVEGVPVQEAPLAYIAMRLIEESNDEPQREMMASDIATLVDHYMGKIESFAKEVKGPELVRMMGGAQFDFNSAVAYEMARTILIYEQIWPTIPEGRQLDINELLVRETGLELGQLFTFGYLFFVASKRGYVSHLPLEGVEGSKLEANFGVSRESEQKFIDWISTDYESFRKLTRPMRDKLDRQHEPFRFNPLVIYPIVRSDLSPMDDHSQGYLVPVPQLLSDRVTKGLYYVMSEPYKHQKGNSFRNAFGKVFEVYVGRLLDAALGKFALIKPEMRYGPSHKPGRCPDWFVIQDGTAVVIEVKQAGLYRDAKLFGKTEDIQRDITQNISEAIAQFVSFSENISKYPELDEFRRIRHWEHVIVTFDPIYFPNSLLKSDIQSVLSQMGIVVPNHFHYHIMSVQALESVLGISNIHLFGLLRKKRNNPYYESMDVSEYLKKISSSDSPKNTLLSKTFDDWANNFTIAFSELDNRADA